MIKISYDHVFLSTCSTVMLASIQKFKRTRRTQNSTQLLLVFIFLTSEKMLNFIPWKNKTTKWETKLFLTKKKANNDSIINSIPARFLSSTWNPSFVETQPAIFHEKKRTKSHGRRNSSHPILFCALIDMHQSALIKLYLNVDMILVSSIFLYFKYCFNI